MKRLALIAPGGAMAAALIAGYSTLVPDGSDSTSAGPPDLCSYDFRVT